MAGKGEASPAGAAGVSRECCIQVWDLLGKEIWKPESVQSQQTVMQQTRPAARGSASRIPHPGAPATLRGLPGGGCPGSSCGKGRRHGEQQREAEAGFIQIEVRPRYLGQ